MGESVVVCVWEGGRWEVGVGSCMGEMCVCGMYGAGGEAEGMGGGREE